MSHSEGNLTWLTDMVHETLPPGADVGSVCCCMLSGVCMCSEWLWAAKLQIAADACCRGRSGGQDYYVDVKANEKVSMFLNRLMVMPTYDQELMFSFFSSTLDAVIQVGHCPYLALAWSKL